MTNSRLDKVIAGYDAVDTVLQKIIVPLVVFLSLLVAGGLVLGIVLRSGFNTPMLGLEEIILFSVMWLYMLGAALASRERSHLSADFAATFIRSARWRHRVHLLAGSISLVMVCAFVVWSYDLLAWGLTHQQSTPVFQIPLYLSQGSMFCASILFLFYVTRDMLNDIRGRQS
ncbi:MAG: TRAP transporter small permease subunit [Gammaproteobacteria bacterium]|nr:TRAP transporter small permease subunit [Gammaproteobacteria bacterium]